MPEPSSSQTGSHSGSLSTLSDEELVRRAQAGQAPGQAAVCELYDRHQNRIFRYLWSRLSDRQTAEDLTGEVFLRMVTGLPKYQPAQAPFQAWLYRIARNLLVDYYRKDNRQGELSLEQVENLQAGAGDPAGAIEGRMFVETVRKGLQRLQPAEGEVIVLRFFLGLSLPETAAILGKSVGAVKIAQHRGLGELRAMFKAEAVEESKYGG